MLLNSTAAEFVQIAMGCTVDLQSVGADAYNATK